jgi:hypothetical protein
MITKLSMCLYVFVAALLKAEKQADIPSAAGSDHSGACYH